MKYAIMNGTIYTGEEVLRDKAVLIENDRISALVDSSTIPQDTEKINIQGLNISPGFIDLQVNGGGGVLLNDDPAAEAIRAIAKGHISLGTTNILPTIFTVPDTKIFQAIEATKQVIKDTEYGILGLHIEGPFISKSKSGVHDHQYIKESDGSLINAVLEMSQGTLKLWTNAPEHMSEEHIKQISQSNIVLSIGHSNATYSQARNAYALGFKANTHLFNGMSEFTHRPDGGIVNAAFDLAYDGVWTTIVADGYHVNFPAIRVAKKILGDRLLLVTDAMPPVGSNIDHFSLGHVEIFVKDGKCTTKEGGLGGSALDMATAVRNCVNEIGIPLEEALRMASTYPARMIGLGHLYGKIQSGYSANFTIFDKDVYARAVVINGRYKTL